MKRLLSLGALTAVIAVLIVAVMGGASIALAQTSGQATLRTPTGVYPFTYVEQSGIVYVSAEEVVAGLGGTNTPDGSGFKVTVGGVTAGFGPDSRYGVVRDDLIEMPVPPIAIEGKPFVPWQFFQGFLAKASSLDVSWDATTRSLNVRPAQRDAISVQVSVANVQGTSKIVVTLSAPAEYGIVKEPGAYTVVFRAPIRAPFAEESYEDPAIARVSLAGSNLRIQLTATDIVGDAYRLENPPRIVLDFRKGAATAPGGLKPLNPSSQQEAPGIRTIVIDPGHGGREVGAVGPNGLMEKDVTLTIARKLAASLSSKVGARVVLTRDDDTVVSLDQRTALANQYKADLFLSVHLNAAVGKDAKGSETYYLSLEASDELARKAAEAENVAGASNPTADLNLILWDLAQQAYIEESSLFAQSIQEEMNAATAVANRGVKQAPFKVLVGATMPAALVEVGFISNPEEEAKLQTDAFQTLLVDALTRAVQRYKTAYETRIGLIQAPPVPATATVPPATPEPAPLPATGTER